MDIISIAQQLISQKLGSDIDSDAITSGLQSLFGGNNGSIDISNLVSSMSSNGALGDILGSWLGDGENMPIDANSVSEMFSGDQLAGFASKLGLDSESASSLLADVVPNVVDQSSSGGSLLDSIGGLEGALSMAKKFF